MLLSSDCTFPGQRLAGPQMLEAASVTGAGGPRHLDACAFSGHVTHSSTHMAGAVAATALEASAFPLRKLRAAGLQPLLLTDGQKSSRTLTPREIARPAAAHPDRARLGCKGETLSQSPAPGRAACSSPQSLAIQGSR